MPAPRQSPSTNSTAQFRRRLLAWYDKNKRDLPWRGSRDPYRVWLSEIMLQQTRVAAVVEYYRRFLKKFPTINRLASVREASVLAAWSGLGYYRRARMLHAAAKKIMREHGGQFPSTAEELRALPGIGRYTSAAIASIAFDEPIAVVDGNVERVLRRIEGRHLAQKELWATAQERLSSTRPGDFNQAMMELGAMVCLPKGPVCAICPVTAFCVTRGEIEGLPTAPRQYKREITYVLAKRGKRVFLTQRPAKATLMPGMWELPENAAPGGAIPWRTFKHSITVTDYKVRVIRNNGSEYAEGKWITRSQLKNMPLTGLARKILRADGIIK